MISITAFFIYFKLFFIFIPLWQITASERISITCKAGTFVGRVKTQVAFNNSYLVNRFLGIPYAEPPIGELRFKKPVRKAPLSNPFDAGEFGTSCYGLNVEMGGKRKPGRFKIDESEDCLFLNIYVPHTENVEEKFPVILKIHGGGYNIGTSTIYPGDILSTFGKLVVITINYRLNIWGFLSTGDEASPGNYGLWDQHMAIEWVQDNIAAFGGDPSMITLVGNSAGSASVIYQALYPGNKGIFQRIIAQSGSPLCSWTFNNNPRKAALKIGRLLDCERPDTDKLIKCIKSKSAENIMAALNKDDVMRVFPMELLPVVDGEFLKHPPNELLNEHSTAEERELFSSFDLLIGITSHDGAVMAKKVSDAHLQSVENFTITEYEFKNKEVPIIARRIFSEESSQVLEDIIMSEYFPWQQPENQTIIREAFVHLSTDYILGIQAARTANVHSALNNKNTYFYLFDTLPSQHLIETPSWLDKPNHCDDLTFLFGHDSESGFTSWTMPYTGEPPKKWELEFTKQYMTMVTNFVKSGDPTIPNAVSSQGQIIWPKYTPERQETFRITRDWNQPVIQRPFAKAMNFWYNVLPSVVQEIRNKDVGYCDKLEP